MLDCEQPEYSLTGAEVTAAVYNTHQKPYGQELFIQMIGNIYSE
jgi:hypothetical protein